ncbi:MAG: glycosyltransferase family 2 protein [Phaeodactylibacter sp.]|nr:glycosyltransferase family 2 protein [Phaeodactylibacter sp.]MCB9274520.1 glycosyltransferase family 2 protein [Lewinellaceae bacterium]
MKTYTEDRRSKLKYKENHAASESLMERPFVSIVVPAYNESAIIEENLQQICDYMQALEAQYLWELIVVNDGSKDNTGQLADAFAHGHGNVKVIHHIVNRNLGGALQTGFQAAKGDYVIVMDIDLTYSVGHIEKLMARILETDADMVIASPYMKGGKNTAVPRLRLLLSKVVNRMMRLMSPSKIHTYTGMVRVYKRSFLQNLNLKSITYSINPEIIFKGIILRARIEEIPAHLDWSKQDKTGRVSSIRIFDGILAGLMSGFIFRPYFLFMGVGLALFLVSFYIILWIFIHTFSVLPEISLVAGNFEDRFGLAVARVFSERPYSFMVGGICLIISFQFLGIGFLSLQNKRYFDELFHINTSLLEKQAQKTERITGKGN